MLIVVALGGNAILPPGSRGSVEDQWRAASSAARALADSIEAGYSVVVTHGNGPQVGLLMEAFEGLPAERPRPTLDLAVAMTQAWIGMMIATALERELASRGLRARALVIPTRVLVSKEDPAFRKPTKPIGRPYSLQEAEELERARGWVMGRDPRGGYRRLVASPAPIKILEVDAIKAALAAGFVPIAVGGGGVPVANSDGKLEFVEAVIDKDLASSLLAMEIGADRFVILTDVPGVAVNFGKEDQRWLRKVSASELRALYEARQFPEGSMGPKVLAAISFVEKTGREAVIGHLEEAREVIAAAAGTLVTP